jgi:UDPglucose 6-dehydrogenase
MLINNVSIIGLGKLGASMAAGMASRGFNVIGVDINHSVVDALTAGKAPVYETNLDKMIKENKARIRATTNHEEAILATDISFVIVPTPSDDKGAFSIQYAASAFRKIGKALRNKKGYHVVVLTSTVLPGATRLGLLPLLESESGKKCGEDFGLCYSPEFIALGSILHDFLNPDFFLAGEFDVRSGDMLESVNKRVALNAAPSRRMSIENAELAKIAINGFITLKISYANMLADMCEKIPGGDVDVVSDALGMDSRIGRKYLTGGFGFGGPCFPRDNVALTFLGDVLEVSTEVPKANNYFNRSLAARTVEKLKPYINKGQTIAILGLAYKPLSHVIEESPGIFLARAFSDEGYRVIGYDPLATAGAREALRDHALIADSLSECLTESEIILVTTRDDLFKNISPTDFLGNKNNITIVDFWRFLNPEIKSNPRIRYIPMGVCINEQQPNKVLADLWTLT